MADPGELRIHLMGQFRVLVGGQPVPDSTWRRRRPAALIQLLALSSGFRLHREQVIDTLWPDLDPGAAGNNLNVTVHELRRALHRDSHVKGPRVDRIADSLALTPAEGVWVDVAAFEKLISDAWRTSEPGVFWKAVDLYSGDLLPDNPYDEWIERRRTSLRASYLTALARVALIHEQQGNDVAAIAALARLLEAEPLDEEATRSLMTCLSRSGQRSQALATYRGLAEALDRELGLEPEPATRDLYQSILDRHPDGSEIIRPLSVPHSSNGPESVTGLQQSNLPAEVTSLIGREREIAELVHHLSASRLVTLTGPGGVGKTTLVLAVAREVAERFSHAFFVPLDRVREAELVLPTVAQTLNVREAPGQTIADGLVMYLGDKHSLLVLDNFEQILDAGRDLAYLLARCRNLKVLVTSRTRLRLQGEYEYPVAPLSIPGRNEPEATLLRFAAVELFQERVRQVRPDLEWSGAQSLAVSEICRRLDGLPLAIELASVRCKVLSPEALLPRLERRLAVLTGGSRDLPERQQTIRDTIAWSYELLSAKEQKLLRCVSVFIGGWDLEAAETILGNTSDSPEVSDVLDLVFSLVDQNLVLADGEVAGQPRFRMLETIREFGREQLENMREEMLVSEAHARYFSDLVALAIESIYGSEQVPWLDRLEREHANIQAALDWYLENDLEEGLRMVGPLWHLWWIRRYLAVGRYYYDAFLSKVDDASVDPVLLAHALTGAGIIAEWQGDNDRAEHFQHSAISIWLDLKDPPEGSYWPFVSLGNTAHSRGDLALAEAWFLKGLEFSREHGLRYGEQVTGDGVAITVMLRGRYDEAEILLRENLENARAYGDTWSISEATRYLGVMHLSLGQYQEARPLLEEGLETAEQLGLAIACADCLNKLGFLEIGLNRLDDGQRRFEESLAIAEEVADSQGSAWAKLGLATIARRRGDLTEAKRLYRESLDDSGGALDQSATPGVIEGLAALYSELGDYQQALRHFAFAEQFRSLREILPTVPELAEIEVPLARSRAALSPDVAERLWEEGTTMTLEEIYAAFSDLDRRESRSKPS